MIGGLHGAWMLMFGAFFHVPFPSFVRWHLVDSVARIGSLQQNPASHYRNSARFRGGILAPYCTSLTIFQTFPAGWVSIVDMTKLNVDESSMDCHDAVIQTSCSACHLAELLAEDCNVPGGCCQCCQTSDNWILAWCAQKFGCCRALATSGFAKNYSSWAMQDMK